MIYLFVLLERGPEQINAAICAICCLGLEILTFHFLFASNSLGYAIISAGRIVIGLYGQVVPKTVGMSLISHVTAI